MKKAYALVLGLVLSLVMAAGATTMVKADTTLLSLSVKIQNEDGTTEEVVLTPAFSASVTEYSATVMNDITDLVVDAKATESTAKVTTEWTNLDVGDNKTYITVTDQAGASTKYTINTKRLTEEEESTYNSDNSTADPSKKPAKNSKEIVTVNKIKMNIAGSFSESLIPKGFSKGTYKYNGKEYPCIKGDKKELTALYLTSTEDDTKGFYIYDEEGESFYAMNNIEIKSRMYTIVNPVKKDSCLKNYTKKTVTIGDKEVRAWVLNDEEKLYLVYAMNWDGDTNLYCYDEEEQCFQRYIADNDINVQLEAANNSYNKLQKKYNELVGTHNFIVKIIAGLILLIVILAFVIFNLILRNKEKKIMDENFDNKDNKLENKDNIEKSPGESINENDNSFDSGEEMFIDITDEVKKEMEDNPDLLEEENNVEETADEESVVEEKISDNVEENQESKEEVKEEAKEEVKKEADIETLNDIIADLESHKEEKKDTKDESEDADDDFVFIDID